jgi:hypothetical protein
MDRFRDFNMLVSAENSIREIAAFLKSFGVFPVS